MHRTPTDRRRLLHRLRQHRRPGPQTPTPGLDPLPLGHPTQPPTLTYWRTLLFDATEKVPLEAPRFKGWYRYTCGERTCRGHRQGVLDWEFVAYQRRLQNLSDERTVQLLRERFFGMVCDPRKDTCFYAVSYTHLTLPTNREV